MADFAYIFGRDGGLTKVDLLERKIAERIVQAGNSIGGAISQDGKLIAVSNYEPGGVKIFDPSLGLVVDIPATYGDDGSTSKVVGLVDAPGQQFLFSLYDAGEIWSADLSDPSNPDITKFEGIGTQPYDGPGSRRMAVTISPVCSVRTAFRCSISGTRAGDRPAFSMVTARARSRFRSTKCPISKAGPPPAIFSFYLPSVDTSCWWSIAGTFRRKRGALRSTASRSSPLPALMAVRSG